MVLRGTVAGAGTLPDPPLSPSHLAKCRAARGGGGGDPARHPTPARARRQRGQGRGRRAPEGMLSAVLRSSGTLGGLPLLRPPCGGGEDSPSLADATQRDSGHPVHPKRILRAPHPPGGQASGPLLHPHPERHLLPATAVTPEPAHWGSCPPSRPGQATHEAVSVE